MVLSKAKDTLEKEELFSSYHEDRKAIGQQQCWCPVATSSPPSFWQKGVVLCSLPFSVLQSSCQMVLPLELGNGAAQQLLYTQRVGQVQGLCFEMWWQFSSSQQTHFQWWCNLWIILSTVVCESEPMAPLQEPHSLAAMQIKKHLMGIRDVVWKSVLC